MEHLEQEQLVITGILSLPVEEHSKKIAINGRDLRSGETRRLAVRNTGETGHLVTNQWLFDPDAMRWADNVLAASTPCDLLVVDELGLLEFERGLGWLSGLKALDEHQYHTAIVVIRPELVEEAQKRWQESRLVEVTPATRPSALDQLLSMTKKQLRH